MSYHPKDVADFGTGHGYDLTNIEHRKELAQEYVKLGKAPSGTAASTIEWHLEHYVKGERVGLYEPDGTTRSANRNSDDDARIVSVLVHLHVGGDPRSDEALRKAVEIAIPFGWPSTEIATTTTSNDLPPRS